MRVMCDAPLRCVAHAKFLCEQQSPSIKVYAAPTAQLLAMKLTAWRDQADIDDAQTLLKNLQGNFEKIWVSVKSYIPKGWELKAKLAFEVLWEASER